MQIEKSSKIGFCYGVRRALDILEKVAKEKGGIETLGEVVHNRQVLQRLETAGVKVAKTISEIRGDAVVLGAHGVAPAVEAEIKARHIRIVNTTCPFVHRAQTSAKRLTEAGCFVVIYGDAEHAEVKGILGWAQGKGLATTEAKAVRSLTEVPHRLGVLSQTTKVPADFNAFVKELVDIVYTKDSEMHIIDTICHDIRERQASAIELAGRVDLMLVIGGRNSANTRFLYDHCSTVVATRKVETATDIDPAWFAGKIRIGVTGGASTADETIAAVVQRLMQM